METHTFDASVQPLGRLATKVAMILMGKNTPAYRPNIMPNVRVVITKSDEVVLTGNKGQQKRYRSHSGYIGHLKDVSADWMREHDSRIIVREAISGMLPKNRSRKRLLKNVVIYRKDQTR